MVREESTDCPLRETLVFIVSFRAIGSSDRKVGSVEYVSPCEFVCVCVRVLAWSPLHPNAMNDTH